jgi:hypothetical protein
MSKKALLAAVVGALFVAAMSAGSAFAGEITGKPPKDGSAKETPIGAAPPDDPHASSICSFSGQNDFHPPDEVGRTAEHVQSWGQIPKDVRDFLTTIGEHPGDACNGHTGAFAGG